MFWSNYSVAIVTTKVLNSYVLEYGQSKIEYLKSPHGAYDRNMEMIYSY